MQFDENLSAVFSVSELWIVNKKRSTCVEQWNENSFLAFHQATQEKAKIKNKLTIIIVIEYILIALNA